MVADVYSGAVHCVDRAAYDLLDYVDETTDALPAAAISALAGIHGEDTLNEAFSDLMELKRKNMLFSKDIYAEIAKNWDKQSVVKALCLHITHDCNLRCAYCFADAGQYGGARKMMDEETGKKAIDFVIAHSGNRKNIEIDYFGGEPLMNFDVVKAITEYAKAQGELHGKHFRFTITTNGMLLDDEISDYINENMGNVVLSIDGRKQVNDKMRQTPNGKGSYDYILPKFQKIADARNQDNYYVRGTFTANNLDFSKDVLHLADLGFLQTSVEPVVLPDESEYAIKEAHLPVLFGEYEALAKEYVRRKKAGKGFNFFHFMMDFDQGPCAYKRLSGCGCGHEYVAVTPDGDIYPCHQFASDPAFLMGNVHTGAFDKKIRDKFMKSNVYTKQDCKDCWAKFYCSGGCLANAQHFNGDIDKPHKISCELERKRVECAMYIAAQLADNRQ